PPLKLVELRAAAPGLAVEWNITDLIAEQIVRGVLQGGECFVRGRGRHDTSLRNISKEIGPTLWPNLLLSREFDEVEIDWKDLVEYGRKLVPTEYENIVSAAEAHSSNHETTARRATPKMTKTKAVADLIREKYPDGIPAGVSYKMIARECGVHDSTV